MPFDIEQIAEQLGAAMIAALKTDSVKVAALAKVEGYKLAWSLARIADLLAVQQIDAAEAQLLARVQKDASEAVLAALAEVSRVAAGEAMARALASVIGIVDSAAGFPIIGTLLQIAVKPR